VTAERLFPRLGAALVLVAAAAVWGTPATAQQRGQPITPRTSVTVDSIVVRGNERLSTTRIVQESGLRTGMDVTYPTVQSAIRKLFATGEFRDVQILVTPADPAVFIIQVEERPFITRYRFEGLTSVNSGTVRDTARLLDRSPLNPSKIARTQEVLEEMLANAGFPRARIDTALVGEGPRREFVFRVNEGPRLALAKIEFEGNEAFSDAELRSAMSTGEEGFLWFQAGQLKRVQYERDLRERLPAFYGEHGYIDFQVLGDTVIVDPRTGKGRVRIRVDEGPQYRLAEFRIRGNRRFPSAELEKRYPLGSQTDLSDLPPDSLPPFDQTSFREATGTIGDFYRNAGYMYARVVPTVERIRPESGEELPRIRATWHVEEGEPAYVRRVEIVGNDYTHDQIIRQRVSLLPGDIYSQQRLIASVQSIQGTGFFDQLPPQESVEMNQLENGDIDLQLRVREKQTGNLNFGASASAGTGLAGFIGYEQPNLFGLAKSGRARWLFGGRSQDIELSYSDPAIMGSRYSGTIALRRSRDEFRTFSLGERRQTGGSIEFGVPVPHVRSTRIFVGYSFFKDEVDDLRLFGVDPEDRELITDGTRSTVSLRAVRDTRNSGQFPTSGSRSAFSTQFSGDKFGGDGDFGKYEFESQWFVPVARIGGGLESRPIEFTASLSMDGGFILGDNPFFRERFFMGGTQVGEQLRGYGEGTITPQGHVPDNARFSELDRVGESFFKTSAMVGVKPTNQLFANVFLDAGNVWGSATEINPTDLLTGAGMGVSLVTPFGPIGIDYAYGFDRRDVLGRPDPGWKLHFKFGRFF